jgi:hypothetical protein
VRIAPLIALNVVGWGLAAVAAVNWWASAARLRTADEERTTLHRFCISTAAAIREDRIDFESGDAQRQERALARYHEGPIMHHNATSIAMCARVETPSLPIGCYLAKEWACLAQHARQVELALIGAE